VAIDRVDAAELAWAGARNERPEHDAAPVVAAPRDDLAADLVAERQPARLRLVIGQRRDPAVVRRPVLRRAVREQAGQHAIGRGAGRRIHRCAGGRGRRLDHECTVRTGDRDHRVVDCDVQRGQVNLQRWSLFVERPGGRRGDVDRVARDLVPVRDRVRAVGRDRDRIALGQRFTRRGARRVVGRTAATAQQPGRDRQGEPAPAGVGFACHGIFP